MVGKIAKLGHVSYGSKFKVGDLIWINPKTHADKYHRWAGVIEHVGQRHRSGEYAPCYHIKFYELTGQPERRGINFRPEQPFEVYRTDYYENEHMELHPDGAFQPQLPLQGGAINDNDL
jgi:hypothetical protein